MTLKKQFEQYFEQLSVQPENVNDNVTVNPTLEVGTSIAEWASAREIDLEEFTVIGEAIQAKVVDDWASGTPDMETAKQIPLTVSFHMFALGYEYARSRYTPDGP